MLNCNRPFRMLENAARQRHIEMLLLRILLRGDGVSRWLSEGRASGHMLRCK
jgi:hypothetical protein